MVILPSNRQEKVSVAITADDPRCRAIAIRYGSIDNLYLQVTNNAPSADTPSLVMCMKTYGQNDVRRQLAARMKTAVLLMGETSMDDSDAEIIAGAICDDAGARILGYDLVMGFFRSLEKGEYELYSCKPRQVMTAWQQYARTAHAKQTRLKEQQERDRRDREYEEHRSQCITFAEFKRRQNNQ